MTPFFVGWIDLGFVIFVGFISDLLFRWVGLSVGLSSSSVFNTTVVLNVFLPNHAFVCRSNTVIN